MTSLSPIQRANFATTSRLLSCAVNEGLVKALYRPNRILDGSSGKKSTSGFTFVLPEDDQNVSTNDQIIVIPMLHKPIVDGKHNDSNQTSVILFIDPWDMTAPICKIGYDASLLSERNNDFTVELEQEIEPSDFMRMLGYWRNLDNEVIDSICAELDNSVKNQEHTYKHPCPIPSLLSSSLEWEQSLIEGRPFHPMHKMRYAVPPIPKILPGSYDFQRPTLRFVEVPCEKVFLHGQWTENLNLLIGLMSPKPTCSPNTVLFPVHELQLPNILEKFPYVKILPSEYSIQASSQSSLRTVVIPEIPELAIKLPLGVILTSSMRIIRPWTTYLGTRLTPILEKLDIDRSILKIMDEVASGVSNESNDDIAEHLGCIFRKGFDDRNSREKIIVCAALFERDYDRTSFIQKIWGLDTEDKRYKFFERYSQLLLRAFLPPILTNGFSFEAHAQNVLARFDSSGEHLIGFVIRDFDGIRVHQETLFTSIGQRVDVPNGNAMELKDLSKLYDHFYYTVIRQNLYRLIRALNLHYSGIGWRIIRQHLSEMVPNDHALRKLLLEKTRVQVRCFLRMKIKGTQRNIIYQESPNLILYKGEDEGTVYRK